MNSIKIQQPPVYSIALISAAALAYEILLMRLFSIIQWHHFAYMIISLSLLGYGASGTFVALFQDRLNKHYSRSYLLLLALFGLSSLLCFLAAQSLPFNPEEVLWDMTQPLILLAMYLLLAIPFFFAASAIALTFFHFSQHIGRVYAFDLFGAGIGSVTVVGFLFLLFPFHILVGVGLLAFVATITAAIEFKSKLARIGTLLALFSLVLIGVAVNSELKLSPYKELPQTLRIDGMQVVAQHSSPLGLLDVVESSSIPLRHAPGLSFMASTEPPPQVGIFTDGGNITVIDKDTGDPDSFQYLDQMTTALPYHLRPGQNKLEDVLILGAGGGSGIQQARFHELPRITAVELNPQLVELVKQDYGEFSGNLFQQQNIDLHIGEGRGFVTESEKQYDLIQVSLLDAFAASSAGLYALNESYIYTVEALQTYLQHIKPDGYLSISRWIKLPPRDSLKLFATAIEALTASGSTSPETQLVLIRSWQTSTLVIKKTPFTPEEINQLKTFSKQRAFDLAWYPGMQANATNKYNQLREPYFYQAALAMLGDNRDSFMDRYKFDLRPSTDDRPYFFHFFKWDVLPEILKLSGQGGMPLLEWGYLVSIATFLQAILVSFILILLPLWALKRRSRSSKGQVSPFKVFSYFFAIGLAFLFIEIAFIQKFVLFLHHPLYATATVITGFLVFAGLGSLWSEKIANKNNDRKYLKMAVIGIAILSVSYLILFTILPAGLLSLPLFGKIILSIMLIAPLAFLMGLPFPLALTSLAENNDSLIPWAWGINGCASVISAILATLLAIHAGFSTVIILAVLLYGMAFISFPGKT